MYFLRSHNILIETTWFISDQIYILPTAGQSRKDNKDRGKRVKSQIGALSNESGSQNFIQCRIFVRPGKYGWNSSLTCLEEISRLNHTTVWAFPPFCISTLLTASKINLSNKSVPGVITLYKVKQNTYHGLLEGKIPL